MATEKEAKKVVTLEDIQFNEENKLMAALTVIPLLGLIFFFVEKEDNFIRYHAAQYVLLYIVIFVLSIIPIIGWMLAPIFSLVGFVLMIVGFLKIYKGDRFDIPVLSDWALKALNEF